MRRLGLQGFVRLSHTVKHGGKASLEQRTHLLACKGLFITFHLSYTDFVLRFNELATKSEKWNGKPRVVCVDNRHPPSKTPVGVLPWTRRSEGL